MEDNRFSKCKTLNDLYEVLQNVSFHELTEDEEERLVLVFEANLPNGAIVPTTPLNEESWTYISNVIADEIIGAAENEITAVEENNNNEEDITMNIKETINNAGETMKNAAKEAANTIGLEKEQAAEKLDKEMNTVKDSMLSVLKVVGEVLGFTDLYDYMLSTIYTDLNGTRDIRSFVDMRQHLYDATKSYIEGILSIDPEKDDLLKVIQLYYIIGKDVNGNPIKGHQSIFDAFFKAIVWIMKWSVRKLKEWGIAEKDAEYNILGSVGAGLSQFFGLVGAIITSVAKIAVEIVIIVGSYAGAAIIKAFAWVFNKLKNAFKKKPSSDADTEQRIADAEEEMEGLFKYE